MTDKEQPTTYREMVNSIAKTWVASGGNADDFVYCYHEIHQGIADLELEGVKEQEGTDSSPVSTRRYPMSDQLNRPLTAAQHNNEGPNTDPARLKTELKPFKYADTWTGLINQIDELRAELNCRSTGWVSVKDRVPEHDKRVVILDMGLPVHGRRVRGSYHDDYAVVLHHVTHWMPLPEGPGDE